MLVILVIASHFARVAKGKIRMIIKTAIIPKSKTPHASAIVHTNLDHNLSLISHSRSTKSTLSNESSDIDKSFNEHETFMQDIQEII